MSVKIIAEHILKQFASRENTSKPLFVAVQGPQGSGKSYLTGLVHDLLSSPPHSFRVVVLSIDDLYLNHASLQELAINNSDNPLWRGRGQPGTHDIELAKQVLSSLRQEDGREVDIPVFDKSLFDGEGDRLPTGNTACTPVDIVIMEGWCMGFHPISPAMLEARWNDVWAKEKDALGLSDAIVGSKQCMETINEVLRSYVDVWSFFTVFVQLQPSPREGLASPYSVIYKWRLEQEHYMKARNGGLGMSDAAVKIFVDRYIPGYVFFGDGVIFGHDDHGTHMAPPWSGKGIRISIDENREVVGVNGI